MVGTPMHCEYAIPLPSLAEMGGMTRVLIVDDDRAIRETLRLVLEDEGYLVSEARDGVQALEILRESHEPLVVLLDFMMPRLDGAGVLRAVVEDTQLATRNAYVLVTANFQSLPKALASLLAQLRVPVLPKPLDIDELLGTVEEGVTRVSPGSYF